MDLTEERLDRLLRYCEVDPADEHRVTKIRDLYPGAVAYLEGAGISEPEEGSLRRESYDLCVNALVLDALDLPELSVAGTILTENPMFRRRLNQLKFSEPASRSDAGSAGG